MKRFKFDFDTWSCSKIFDQIAEYAVFINAGFFKLADKSHIVFLLFIMYWNTYPKSFVP